MSAQRNSPKRNPITVPENAVVDAAIPLTVHGRGQSSAARIRVTPRNSIADEDTAVAKDTPFNTLHQLGRVANMLPRPATPLRRASSAGPHSTRRSTRRTPIAQERTPGGLAQPGSTRRLNVLTPHARAAVKENELRRAAALTPGKDRRRSGRQQQRETPQNDLRMLSRILAPTSKAAEITPQIEVPSAGKILLAGEDDLDGTLEPRPRLSIPLDEDEDDSLLPPMRSIGFVEEENLTQQSVELPRRAFAGQREGRLSRGSFGSVRTSDRVEDINEQDLDALMTDDNDSTFIQQRDFDDFEATNVQEDVSSDIQRPYLEDGTGRISLASGRTSDIRPQAISEDETEITFLLPLPQRDSLPSRLSAGGIVEMNEEENEYDDTRDQSVEADDLEDSEIDQVGAENEDATMGDQTVVQSNKVSTNRNKSHRIKKRIKISKYGIQYPSLPAGVVKRLATTFLKTNGNGNAKLSKDTLATIMQGSDWFFEQVSDDLGTYAQHAGRKTIDENDVVTLMKRQRQTNATLTPFALAQRYLPRELLQELRMAQPLSSKSRKVPQLESLDEEEGED